MRKNRDFVEGVFYHVTSRTNDKIRVFENKIGLRIILMVLQDAKEKFRFILANFCVMPTHIHLLIKPAENTNLSVIMHWIKTQSAKRWNSIHCSKDHMWGNRFFSRILKNQEEFNHVMEYIDQNPVVAGLAASSAEWKPSGIFYREHNIPGLDLSLTESHVDLPLCKIPLFVSRLIPAAQLKHISKYQGAYFEQIELLKDIIPKIPKIRETGTKTDSPVYLHFFTKFIDYFIYEYDGVDKFYGKIRYNVFPAETEYRIIGLSELKSNNFMELDLSWQIPEK